MTIQAKAQELLAELDKVRYSPQHQPLLFKGIMELAELCGTKLKPPQSYANQDVLLHTVDTEDGSDAIGYGEQFAELMNHVPVRCGPRFYFRNNTKPYNCFGYVNYWNVEELIRKAACQESPTN